MSRVSEHWMVVMEGEELSCTVLDKASALVWVFPGLYEIWRLNCWRNITHRLNHPPTCTSLRPLIEWCQGYGLWAVCMESHRYMDRTPSMRLLQQELPILQWSRFSQVYPGAGSSTQLHAPVPPVPSWEWHHAMAVSEASVCRRNGSEKSGYARIGELHGQLLLQDLKSLLATRTPNGTLWKSSHEGDLQSWHSLWQIFYNNLSSPEIAVAASH